MTAAPAFSSVEAERLSFSPRPNSTMRLFSTPDGATISSVWPGLPEKREAATARFTAPEVAPSSVSAAADRLAPS